MGVNQDNGTGQNPRKPLFYYMIMVFLITMLLNALVFPSVMQKKVVEVAVR